MLDRIWKICLEQDARDLSNEVTKLKIILAKNEYPTHIIEKEINKFITNRNKQPLNNVVQQQINTTEKPVKYIVLPHVNNKVIDFGKRLKNFVEKNFDEIELKVVFVAPLEIRNLFKFKDKLTDKFKQSCVVYRLNCLEETCKKFYIGKCDRILGHRLKEHCRKSTAKTPNKNAPYIHSEITGHEIDYNGILIIDRADFDFKLKIKETLHIRASQPELNTLCTSEFDIKTLTF